MKNISILSAIIILLTLGSCNSNTKTDRLSNKSSQNTRQDSSGKMPMAKEGCVTVSSEDSAKFISKQITVKGDIENPLTLTVDSLKKMNVTTIENFVVVCQSGENKKEDKTCKGVLLKEVLDKARIRQFNHKDRNFYIVARASDNYKATFSWAEIYNNPTGNNVYIIFEENEQTIKQQGDMILICTNDIKTGPRHVYWLSSIEVNRVD